MSPQLNDLFSIIIFLLFLIPIGMGSLNQFFLVGSWDNINDGDEERQVIKALKKNFVLTLFCCLAIFVVALSGGLKIGESFLIAFILLVISALFGLFYFIRTPRSIKKLKILKFNSN